MLRRFFSLIFILFLLTGCVRTPSSTSKPASPPAAKRIVQNRPLPAFNRIDAQGNINVSLHTGYAKPQIILRGDMRDLVQVKTEVRNNTLLLNLGKGYPRFGPISAEIRGRYLNGFSYRGTGTINGTKLHSGLLDLTINNPGTTTLGGSIFLRKLKVAGGGNLRISGASSQSLQLSIADKTQVQLSGMMNLSCLNMDGTGRLSMYWIKSKALTIRGKGNSFMQLAGIVDKLDVELWGASRFQGRFLRAKRAFVKTHNKSVADITALKHQHTLATDASDIYFYEIPDTKANFMAFNGSVLDMRDWNQSDMRDYDRYNK